MEIACDILFKIIIYSHCFKIVNIRPRMHGIIQKYCTEFILFAYERENNKQVLKPSKVFATRIANGSEYRFHIGQLAGFIKQLERNFIYPDMYVVEYAELYNPVKTNITIRPNWKLRDYQENISKFILQNDPDDNKSRLVALYTGGGKTMTALYSIAKLNQRIAIVILPGYIDKWTSDILKITNTKPKDIMVVQGSDQLIGAMNLAKDKQFNSKFLIMSLTTIQNFYKTYEQNAGDVESFGYPCHPEEMFKLFSIGTCIIDEIHQHLYSVYKLTAYMHVPKLVGLSGTFMSYEPTVQMVQKFMFPREVRYDRDAMKKYIHVRAVSYSFKDIKQSKIRTTSFGSNLYSHSEYEKSILRNHKVLDNYIRLIDSLVKIGYIDKYEKGDKLIIFAASIKMCTVLTDFFTNQYPNLDVRRYVEEDPYENIIDADIRITTIQSGGTAVDIPNLRTAILTTNIKSPVSNLQALGRLREIPGKEVYFYYIYCDEISKQRNYHMDKKELFADRTASIKEFHSPVMI